MRAKQNEDIRKKIKNGIYKLKTNEGKRSTVWRVFQRIEKEDGDLLKEYIFCTVCGKLISFAHKNANLRRHKCHEQYLKKQANSSGVADANSSKEWSAEETVDEAEINAAYEEFSVVNELDTMEDAKLITQRGASNATDSSEAINYIGQSSKVNEDPLTTSKMRAKQNEDIRNKIKNGIYKLKTNEGKRSTVWRVFQRIEKEDGDLLKEYIFCTVCKKLISFAHKNNANLRRHKCHEQYLKKQANSSGVADANSSKEWVKYKDAEMSAEETVDEAEIKVAYEEFSSVVNELDTMEDAKLITQRGASNATDSSEAINYMGQSSKVNEDPLNVTISNSNSRLSNNFLSHGVSGVEEIAIHAQTWSLEYSKLTEEQQFYAKRAINEIFVLGRLGRLTLTTVPAVIE